MREVSLWIVASLQLEPGALALFFSLILFNRF